MSHDPYTPPAKPSGGGGGTFLVVALVVAGVVVLGCIGLCGLGALGMRWGAQQAGNQMGQFADKFGEAMMAGLMQAQAGVAVQQNPEVREKLGNPVQFGPPITDKMDLQGGSLAVHFTATGSKGNGTVHLEGRQQANEWKITSLNVKLSDGSTIEIDPSSIGNLSDLSEPSDPFSPSTEQSDPFSPSVPIPEAVPPPTPEE